MQSIPTVKIVLLSGRAAGLLAFPGLGLLSRPDDAPTGIHNLGITNLRRADIGNNFDTYHSPQRSSFQYLQTPETCRPATDTTPNANPRATNPFGPGAKIDTYKALHRLSFHSLQDGKCADHQLTQLQTPNHKLQTSPDQGP